MAKKKTRSLVEPFKPYVVKRPGHECQVLFPLSKLDDLVGEVIEIYREMIATVRRSK